MTKSLGLFSGFFILLIIVVLVAKERVDSNGKITKLEQQITQIEQEIKENRLQAMNNQIEGQRSLLYDWDEYTDSVQDAENNLDRVEALEKKLKHLIKERDRLKKLNSHVGL